MIALSTVMISFVGALVCGLMPPDSHRRIRWVALLTAVLGLTMAFVCALEYQGTGFKDEFRELTGTEFKTILGRGCL